MYVDLKKQQDDSIYVIDAIDNMLEYLEEDVSYITIHTRGGDSITLNSKDFTKEQIEELGVALVRVQSTHLFKLEKLDSIIKESGLV